MRIEGGPRFGAIYPIALQVQTRDGNYTRTRLDAKGNILETDTVKTAKPGTERTTVVFQLTDGDLVKHASLVSAAHTPVQWPWDDLVGPDKVVLKAYPKGDGPDDIDHPQDGRFIAFLRQERGLQPNRWHVETESVHTAQAGSNLRQFLADAIHGFPAPVARVLRTLQTALAKDEARHADRYTDKPFTPEPDDPDLLKLED